MKQLKHHKTRNTGFLYEVLVKQLTTDLLNNNLESLALKMIKKYFSEGAPLFEELSLYNTLLKTKSLDKDKAEMLIDETLKTRKKLNEQNIIKKKYELVKEIKESFDIKGMFTSKMSNYKVLASIYKLFESELNSHGIYDPTIVVESRFTVKESITTEPVRPPLRINADMLSKFSSKDRTVKLLTLQNIIKKFNRQYENLSNKQKDLLKVYMDSLSDNSILENYLKIEVPIIQKSLKEVDTDNAVLKIKLDEISRRSVKLLSNDWNKYNKIIQIMKIYEIIEEVRKDKKDSREEITE